MTTESKMSPTETHLKPESEIKEAGDNDLQIKLQLAKIELEMKKLDISKETLRMQYAENTRVREHELQMATLKNEEMKAQKEIEKQRFEERELVMKEVQNIVEEYKKQLNALQIQLLQAKECGKVNFKENVLAISAIAEAIRKCVECVKAAVSSISDLANPILKSIMC